MPEQQTLREIDALVAEKVMGWKCHRCIEGKYHPIGEHEWFRMTIHQRASGDRPIKDCDHFLAYSSDISAAWEVVEKMKDDGFYCVTLVSYKDAHHCTIEGADTTVAAHVEDAPTAPIALCLASLRAVGVDVEVMP